jgi:hypothetical protein
MEHEPTYIASCFCPTCVLTMKEEAGEEININEELSFNSETDEVHEN